MGSSAFPSRAEEDPAGQRLRVPVVVDDDLPVDDDIIDARRILFGLRVGGLV